MSDRGGHRGAGARGVSVLRRTLCAAVAAGLALAPGCAKSDEGRATDRPEPPVDGRKVPDYWIRPPQRLSAEEGLHRFVWDLRHETPAAASFGYPIAAIHRGTPREPRGPWVVPGTYTARLTADGRVRAQPVTVVMDPRVKTPPADIEAQHALSMRLCDAMGRARTAQGASPPPEGEAVGRLRQLHALLTRLLDTRPNLQVRRCIPFDRRP